MPEGQVCIRFGPFYFFLRLDERNIFFCLLFEFLCVNDRIIAVNGGHFE